MIETPSATFEVVVSDEDAGARVDRVLARQLPSLSRARIQRLIKDGHVIRAEHPVHDAASKVEAGDRLRVLVPPPEAATPLPQEIPLQVLYEDAHLLVVDKPQGLVVHPAAGHPAGTLVNALLAHCGDSLSGIGGVKRPGIVHRLDKDTTGLLVVAKTDQAHRALADQFADHGRTGPLRRAYLALVWGNPERARFTIDRPLARSTGDREKMAVAAGGRQAITHVEVLERFGPPGSADAQVALLRCVLETGRTHQIRVHLAAAGHPLLGDQLYGRGFFSKAGRLPPLAQAALKRLGRQALHAAELGFEHPESGTLVALESAPPNDLAQLLEALRAWKDPLRDP